VKLNRKNFDLRPWTSVKEGEVVWLPANKEEGLEEVYGPVVSELEGEFAYVTHLAVDDIVEVPVMAGEQVLVQKKAGAK
jgi:hypothetical protein